MYRLINYLFGFIIVYLFILEAGMNDHAQILLGLLLSCIMAFVAFFGNWITLDATKAVILLGTIILGFAGWLPALAVIFFFLSSNYLTGRKRESNPVKTNKMHDIYSHHQTRRDGYQIWANGFWMALFSIGFFVFETFGFLIAVFTTIAAATADTWATEIGTNNPGKTRNILTFKETEPGSDGGISLKGTIGAILGAFLIAIFVLPADVIFSSRMFVTIFILGVAGCFIDSFLGALLADKEKSISIPDDFSGSGNSFLNSLVNWASIGLSGLLALLATQFLI